jgi:hypothetical protein
MERFEVLTAVVMKVAILCNIANHMQTSVSKEHIISIFSVLRCLSHLLVFFS